MGFVPILFLSVGLAMDATAVAAARGFATERIVPRHVVLVGGLFGGFQGLMPLLGWLVGREVGGLVADWDHWIAFAVLAFLGLKMIREALGERGEERPHEGELYALRALVPLAVATSIDALAVGVTLPMLGAPVLLSCLTIAVTTAVLSVAGLFAGRLFGALLGPRLEAVGGLVLVLLGVSILVEHVGAGR